MSELNGLKNMNDNVLDEYKSLIEIAIAGNNLSDLDQIKEDYREKCNTNIQTQLEEFELELLEKNLNNKTKSKDDKLKELFIKKQTDALCLWNKTIPFGEWLRYEYLPNFHTLTFTDIQAPIAACVMLLNPSLYLTNTSGDSLTPLPNIICLGSPSSGKTTWARQLLKFHDRRYAIENRTSTNIALIEHINKLNNMRSSFRTPCPIVLLDNLEKTDKRDDFKVYEDLLKATIPSESVREISSRASSVVNGGSNSFNFYNYTIGTTILDIRPLAQADDYYQQITSRTIWLMFKMNNSYKSLADYDWSGFAKVYASFWNDDDNIHNYVNAFDDFPSTHIDFGFPDKRSYDISLMCMATGITWGVFTDTMDALSCFSEYWNSLDQIIDVIRDPYIELIRTYVNNIHPKKMKDQIDRLIRQKKELGWDVSLDIEDTINKKDIEDYLKNVCGVRLTSSQWRVDVPILFRALGYTHDPQREGYIFVKKS